VSPRENVKHGTAAILACTFSAVMLLAQQASPPDVTQLQRSTTPEQRIPQQKTPATGALQGILLDAEGRPLPGAAVQLVPTKKSNAPSTQSAGDGIFRLPGVREGIYDLLLTPAGAGIAFRRSGIRINSGEVLSIEVRLTDFTHAQTPRALPQSESELAPAELAVPGDYHELSRRPDAEGALVPPKELELAPESVVFLPRPDRWNTEMPDYHRYSGGAETPYVLGHWYDPFNRNRLKGDKPVFGQKTFFSFTGDSITAVDGRRVPITSGQSTANPGESGFFGNGRQFFLSQTFRMTFDLFHGDTAAFRPVDWRLRITPAANINYLNVHENGIVSPDVRAGTTRTDGHMALQEAFAEVKLHDFGLNYDFSNLRVGIQQFVSDFRGFIFADEEPGVRLFGNLRSNRIQWNLAAFDLLEKNTNSGLNTFHRRGREVAIGNVYIQDFGAKGYTAQFSYHFVRDDGGTHYDDNGFLVRPAPIGSVAPHRIDAHYAGWAGDGHIGRTNITHALYQAWGNDTPNQIAGKRTRIDAQLAALELSRDEDWLRFRLSFLYASGDNDPRNGTARGFSSIVDGEAFAGGEFSFFNREGIRLTGTGVALTAPDSFLPDLRASKDEGQSNFVNPGLYLYNAGADAKLTPTLKLVSNVNFLQFARTQALVFLLQQNGIRRTIGTDASLGFLYRPLLSDNIVLTGGAAALVPGRGLHDIYTGQILYSLFGTVRFQF
jgi:hypothetical protein